jgi:hypothetical protein
MFKSIALRYVLQISNIAPIVDGRTYVWPSLLTILSANLRLIKFNSFESRAPVSSKASAIIPSLWSLWHKDASKRTFSFGVELQELLKPYLFLQLCFCSTSGLWFCFKWNDSLFSSVQSCWPLKIHMVLSVLNACKVCPFQIVTN